MALRLVAAPAGSDAAGVLSARLHWGAGTQAALALCEDGTLRLQRGSDDVTPPPALSLALRGAGGAQRRCAAAEWAPSAALPGLLVAQAGPSGRVLFARLPSPASGTDGAPVWLLGRHPAAATALAVSSDWAASGAADGSLRLWRLSDGALAGTHAGSGAAVTALALVERRQLSGAQPGAPLPPLALLSGHADGTALLWAWPGSAAALVPLTRLRLGGAVTALAAHAGAGLALLAAGDCTGGLALLSCRSPDAWTLPSGWLPLAAPGLEAAPVASLAWRADGAALAAAAGGAVALLRRVGPGALGTAARTPFPAAAPPLALRFVTPPGAAGAESALAAACGDGGVRLLDAAFGWLQAEDEAEGETATGGTDSPDEPALMSEDVPPMPPPLAEHEDAEAEAAEAASRDVLTAAAAAALSFAAARRAGGPEAEEEAVPRMPQAVPLPYPRAVSPAPRPASVASSRPASVASHRSHTPSVASHRSHTPRVPSPPMALPAAYSTPRAPPSDDWLLAPPVRRILN